MPLRTLLRGERTLLRIEPLTAEGVSVSAEDVAAQDRSGGEDTMFAVRLRAKRTQWRNAVALSWSSAEGRPAGVTLSADGDIWTFRTGDRTVALNWTTGEAAILGQAVRDADFDSSGSVDFPDFLLFARAFNSDQVRYDLNGDGRVDFIDFLLFARL